MHVWFSLGIGYCGLKLESWRIVVVVQSNKVGENGIKTKTKPHENSS